MTSQAITFYNANDAFDYYYDYIMHSGKRSNSHKTLYILNCGFYIMNPQQNEITEKWRKWNKEYAEYEWQWYLSGDQNADAIAERAKIWKQMQDEDGNVRSNYGYQWNRNGQLDYVVQELQRDPNSRRAVISLYDGKEHSTYQYDTPCTLAIHFYIEDNKLDMSVMMRSNDLVYGFCNDQYCFSKLQQLIAERLGCEVGIYYHFASNMHIYERHFSIKK